MNCQTCGHPAQTGDGRCLDCLAVESRLADYLRRGGENARQFVFRLASEALLASPKAQVRR